MARTKHHDTKAAEILTRQLNALELRKSGFSYRKIGERLNVSHEQVRTDVETELRRLAEENHDKADEVRQLEIERIDRAVSGIMHWIDAGSPAHVQALARLISERAKLLGLYAPQKQEISINLEVVTRFEAVAKELGQDPALMLEQYIQELHALSATNPTSGS